MWYFLSRLIHHLLGAVTLLTGIPLSLVCPAGRTPHCPVQAVGSAVAPHSATLLLPADHQTPVCHLGNSPLWSGNMVSSGETL